MAFDIAATCRAIQTHLVDSELFFKADISRPIHPVGVGPTATIQGESMRVVAVTTTAIELHVVKVRIWRARDSSGEEVRELEAMELTTQVLDLFYGDITLGAGIRNVDIAGEYGDGIVVSFEDDDIETAPYHVADITLPLVVDSATVLAR